MSWWEIFGGHRESLLVEIRIGSRILGIAPLYSDGETARFMGGADVCDYQDVMVEQEADERGFFGVLLDFLKNRGIRQLDLRGLRSDSATMRGLPPAARDLGCECLVNQEDVSYELALPSTWDGYLADLPGKERHEIHRKFRRLEENFSYRLEILEDTRGVVAATDEFLHLFGLSRPEKKEFLTEQREHFLRRLVRSMAEDRMVRLYFLEISGTRAAAALCFDYRGARYLYNSGLHPDCRQWSAGLICKVLTLRQSILEGAKTYDFLKGNEVYKHRLGAKPIPVSRCSVKLHRA
jgi:CelD/BcsL family acetyltransferase involved in cellulose biosynthesis